MKYFRKSIKCGTSYIDNETHAYVKSLSIIHNFFNSFANEGIRISSAHHSTKITQLAKNKLDFVVSKNISKNL